MSVRSVVVAIVFVVLGMASPTSAKMMIHYDLAGLVDVGEARPAR